MLRCIGVPIGDPTASLNLTAAIVVDFFSATRPDQTAAASIFDQLHMYESAAAVGCPNLL